MSYDADRQLEDDRRSSDYQLAAMVGMMRDDLATINNCVDGLIVLNFCSLALSVVLAVVAGVAVACQAPLTYPCCVGKTTGDVYCSSQP